MLKNEVFQDIFHGLEVNQSLQWQGEGLRKDLEEILPHGKCTGYHVEEIVIASNTLRKNHTTWHLMLQSYS